MKVGLNERQYLTHLIHTFASGSFLGDEIHVSKKKVFDDLHSLSCYAVEKLSIDRFGKKECAITQAFLNDPYTRVST